MATDHYRSAELVFGWSFYRQGSSGDTSSADEFLAAALNWFGDPDPRVGNGVEERREIGEARRASSTLLILDGLEALRNPPGAQEGRIREPSLQALLRELAAFNRALCVITTRLPLFSAVICGCNAGLFRDALHEVYIPRIQRGNAYFCG